MTRRAESKTTKEAMLESTLMEGLLLCWMSSNSMCPLRASPFTRALALSPEGERGGEEHHVTKVGRETIIFLPKGEEKGHLLLLLHGRPSSQFPMGARARAGGMDG